MATQDPPGPAPNPGNNASGKSKPVKINLTVAPAQTAAEDFTLTQLSMIFMQPLHEEEQDGITTQGAQPATSLSRELIKCIPEQVYTRSRDSKGHSVMGRYVMPQHWIASISAIVEGLACYRCKEDFFRDAIFHRLAYLINTVNPIAQSEISAIYLQGLQERYENQLANARDAMASTAKLFRRALSQRDWTQAQEIIEIAARQIPTLNHTVQDKFTRRLAGYRTKLRLAMDEHGTK